MAQRRMFSKDITEHDAFLDMPLSTQALYFHLGMHADDDGFVSPKKVQRMIGASSDDLHLLVAKKFVLQFEDGVIVIKHWKINNYLRNDRYKQSSHIEKMALISLKSNSAYTWSTSGIPLVDAGKDSIGKDTNSEPKGSAESKLPFIDNKKKDMSWNKQSDDYEEGVIDLDGDMTLVEKKKKNTAKYPNAPEVRKLFSEVLGKNPANWKVNKTQLQSCENLYTERGLEKIKLALQYAKENREEKYCPKIDSPYDLDSKWTKLGEHKLANV